MIKNLTFAYKIFILFGVFIVGLLFTAILAQGLSLFPISITTTLQATMALQNVLVFILPALVLALFINKQKPFAELTLNIPPTLKSIFAFIIIFIAVTPALNAIVAWNESLTLPASMAELEATLREMEKSAGNIVDNLLINSSIFSLIFSIIIIGLLTGIGEELFFRGALQRAFMARPMNKHLAIWITAIVFSLLHFQFFGFVPRILLGAFFGYLYVWSGTIWLPIIGHAINNTLVIVFKYLSLNGHISTTIDDIGTTADSMPIVVVSVALTIATIIYSKKYLFK